MNCITVLLHPWWVILLIGLTQQAPTSHNGHKPTLLLVSFDGFRWDYLSKTATPNFDRITKAGIRAKWTKDAFISVTYPNHYTIVTGLYEESHGIVANTFYDPVFDEVFNMENKTNIRDGKFWGGEPLWVTNQLQGGRTGVYYWVGSEAEIKGVRPNIWEPYEDKDPTMKRWKNRTDTVVKWLTDPELMVDLALMYFKEPDGIGHRYGPDSPELVKMVQQCDRITGYLLDRLEEHNLLGKLNIIMTSDHGMTLMDKNRFITLDDHIDESKIKHLLDYVDGASVWPINKDVKEELYQNLTRINKHVAVWKKPDIPSEYHYNNSRRVPPILLSANEGWGIKRNWRNKSFELGNHGFNNSKMDMHPFFIATGPVFKEGYVSEPFENIHIYELMCHILGLKPAPNNGTFEAISHLLRPKRSIFDQPPYRMLALAGVAFVIIVIVGLRMNIMKENSMKAEKKIQQAGKVDKRTCSEFDDESELLMA